MIGLTGAHRSGKTTLARAVSARTGLPFLPSPSGATHADLGFDPGGELTFEQRLAVQALILERAERDYMAMKVPFISDRTPYDFAAYLLADVGRRNVTDKQQGKVREFLDLCWDVAGTYFGMIFIVPPTIPYVVEPGKPPASLAGQEQFNALVLGLAVDERRRSSVNIMERNMTALDERVSYVTEWYLKTLETHCPQEEFVAIN